MPWILSVVSFEIIEFFCACPLPREEAAEDDEGAEGAERQWGRDLFAQSEKAIEGIGCPVVDVVHLELLGRKIVRYGCRTFDFRFYVSYPFSTHKSGGRRFSDRPEGLV